MKAFKTMKVFVRVVLFSFALLTVLTPANAVAQVVQIFWSVNQGPFGQARCGQPNQTTTNKIQRANPDGSGVSDLVTGLNRPMGIAVAGGQLYFNDWNTFKTQRVNLDGSGLTTLHTGPLCGKNGIAVDVAGSRVFVGEGTPGAEAVVRTNFDGTGRTALTRTGFPGQIALDLANGHVYSANADASFGNPIAINRQNLDGTGFTSLLSFGVSDRPRGIALDLSAGHIYFTVNNLGSTSGGSVRRANLDGSGLITLVSGLNFPHDIALDLAGGEMYFTDVRNGVIQRANLDGSSVTTLVSGINQPHGIALEIQVEIDVSVDIKPGSCPNPVNPGSGGYIPISILGTADFDPMDIDLATVVLFRADGVGVDAFPNEGQPGPHSVFDDTATPFDGELCDCHELEGDGFDDLSMKFKTQNVVAALELDLEIPGTVLELVVSGILLDGTPFVGSDCIVIVGGGP